MEWNWNIQPNKYMPSGRTYYEEQVLDPKIEYNFMVNIKYHIIN